MSPVASPPTPATGRLIRAASSAATTVSRDQQIVEQARREADEILARAHEEAAAIRAAAAAEGHAEGLATAALAAPAPSADPRPAATLESLEAQLAQLRHEWLHRWEGAIIPLAAAIATRIVRRAVAASPEITLDLVREALELAASGGRVRVLLHPDDLRELGAALRQLEPHFGRFVSVEWLAHDALDRGDCQVLTEHGEIDQRFATQLARIVEELT